MTTPPDAPDNYDQFDEEETEQHLGATASGRKRLFSKELRCMMYGFGDDQNPYTESVDFLEDLVIEFITDTTHRAMEVGRTGRVQVEDIIFLVRKDQRKYARVKDLLTMNEELKKARKAFDEVKYVVPSTWLPGRAINSFVCRHGHIPYIYDSEAELWAHERIIARPGSRVLGTESVKKGYSIKK